MSSARSWPAIPAWPTAYAPDGFTALGLASFFGHREAAELLLAAGARVNDASRNPMRVAPLHSALAGGHAEIVELLLDAGADVNAVQADGYTPLHEAAQNGDQAIAERLVERWGGPRGAPRRRLHAGGLGSEGRARRARGLARRPSILEGTGR